MPDGTARRGPGPLAVLLAVAVGAALFFGARAARAATAPVVSALTPQAPEPAGVFIRGRSASAFIPIPVDQVLGFLASFGRPTPGGETLVAQPGGGLADVREVPA